jgi:hypothetical protein
MNNIIIFTQTYSDDRKILFDIHNYDEQDIKFRNNFDNLYVFHNCSDSYIEEIKNSNYLKSINNIRYLKYNGINYMESFRKTMNLIKNEYNYLMFIQDDCFTNTNDHLEEIVKFIINENYLMLNLETELNINNIYYKNNDFIVYNTNSVDFSNSIDNSNSYYNYDPSTEKHYWCFDDGPYVANIDFLNNYLYDENYYNNYTNILDGEIYLMEKIKNNPIQRLTMNKYLYKRRNIVGPHVENFNSDMSYLKNRFLYG